MLTHTHHQSVSHIYSCALNKLFITCNRYVYSRLSHSLLEWCMFYVCICVADARRRYTHSDAESYYYDYYYQINVGRLNSIQRRAPHAEHRSVEAWQLSCRTRGPDGKTTASVQSRASGPRQHIRDQAGESERRQSRQTGRRRGATCDHHPDMCDVHNLGEIIAHAASRDMI